MENAAILLVLVLAIFLFAGEPDLTDAFIQYLSCEANQ